MSCPFYAPLASGPLDPPVRWLRVTILDPSTPKKITIFMPCPARFSLQLVKMGCFNALLQEGDCFSCNFVVYSYLWGGGGGKEFDVFLYKGRSLYIRGRGAQELLL